MNKNQEKRFDEMFGKMKDGAGFGDDVSVGRGAGCDDCESNQKWRAEVKSFITTLLEGERSHWETAVKYNCEQEVVESILAAHAALSAPKE